MQHTYLRYECADSFSLAASTPSTTTNTTQTLAILSPSSSSSSDLVISSAGSQCVAFDLRSGNPTRPYAKIGYRDDTTNVGTGRALNSNECTCLDVYCPRAGTAGTKQVVLVSTGWVDGSVRVFDLSNEDENYNESSITGKILKDGLGVVNSLLDSYDNDDEDIPEPLVLNGHSNSPVTCVSFDVEKNGSRLASASSDGTIVIWDIIAETGLFRLIGHHKTITSLAFIAPKSENNDGPSSFCLLDGLISTSLDGLVKVWDLSGQCCTQTVAGHRGEIWTSDAVMLRDNKNKQNRWRLITGSSDNQLRVYDIHPPKRATLTGEEEEKDLTSDDAIKTTSNIDDVLTYIGSVKRQTNERTALVRFHSKSKLLAVSIHQSKNIEIYGIRSTEESERRRVRRLRRRREKQNKKSSETKVVKKKGILDEEEDDHDIDDVNNDQHDDIAMSPEKICASDEFYYLGTVRASHKVRSFAFSPSTDRAVGSKIIISLTTNALETHSLKKKFNKEDGTTTLSTKRISTLDQYGHPTGIRSVCLSSADEKIAATISKGMLKVWSVPTRSCVRSLPLNYAAENGDMTAVYALCCKFIPFSSQYITVGTKEGHILIIDVGSGDVVYIEEKAHDGAIWSIDIKSDSSGLMTGSGDNTVKFWELEEDEEDGEPSLVHTRTLEMKDDVVALQYSYIHDKRLVMVSTLDCSIQIYYEDNLKFFLNLYGHKLPVLALDCSDDDTILASGGADKTIKIWGLDFGDVHKTLYGHTDSITDIKFVKKTHNFFSCARDKTVRYWDGDRFESILVLHGHFAEVNSLAISKTGAYVLSAGMDRQVRVWERTKDMVFIEEEKEREMDRLLDQADGNKGEEKISMKVGGGDDDDDEEQDQPQSEEAVRRSVLSVASGDRIMEALEIADAELKDTRSRKGKKATPNPLLLGMEPHQYIFWVLRSVKSSELEQSLMVLPLNHVERLMYYLIVLLRKGMGVELCAKVTIFLVKVHQNQIIATHTLSTPLQELRRLVKIRVGECRDTVGFNLAAMQALGRAVNERNESFGTGDGFGPKKDVFSSLGLGSDVAAALMGRDRKRTRR